MKITAIKPFSPKVGARNVLIVKVETDAGISGLGEGGTSGRELAMEGMISHFAEFLVGQDPRRIEDIWQTLYRGQYFEGGTVVTAAISAIDIALWDILGKSLGTPVYQLLGGRSRQYVRCYCGGGELNGPECVETTKQRVAEGWRTVRFSPGMPPGTEPDVYEPRESIDLALHWLGEVRRAVGSEPRLVLDFHTRLNVAEARKVAGWAEAHYIDLVPHNPLGPVCTAASAHLCTAINNFCVQEQGGSGADFPPDLFTVGYHWEEDRLILSDAPGLGVEFHEEAAADHGFEFWEAPHWRRRDGALTNW